MIPPETDGEQIFLGQLAISIQQLGMDGDPAGAVSRLVGHADGLGVAGTRNSRKPLAHHPESLP